MICIEHSVQNLYNLHLEQCKESGYIQTYYIMKYKETLQEGQLKSERQDANADVNV